jgi:hypothetical protein
MGKGDQQRYINITKIEIIFADAWRHLVTTTFHLRWPFLAVRIDTIGHCSAIFESEEQ